MSSEFGPKVSRGEGFLRVSDIRSDTSPLTSMSIIAFESGGVGISIISSQDGTVGIDLASPSDGGASPEITAAFSHLTRELANKIEPGGE
jgi:hypothetical protein